jgi:Trk-type K+ transport system membrane component
MNLVLFIAAIVVSFIVVRIGAIAFELTGLEWSLAKFQSLSCFSGTGFTTREAELIVGNPQRRRIASVLMVLGNAGLVTLIATFANSLRPSTIVPKINLPYLELVFPQWLLPWMNLLIIVIAIYAIYRVSTHSKFTRKFTNYLKRNILKKQLVKPVSFEELVVATGGYGVSSIEVDKKSPVVNKTLEQGHLRSHDITVLVVERAEEAIPNPPASTKILEGDTLICFGKLESMREQLYSIPR